MLVLSFYYEYLFIYTVRGYRIVTIMLIKINVHVNKNIKIYILIYILDIPNQNKISISQYFLVSHFLYFSKYLKKHK